MNLKLWQFLANGPIIFTYDDENALSRSSLQYVKLLHAKKIAIQSEQSTTFLCCDLGLTTMITRLQAWNPSQKVFLGGLRTVWYRAALAFEASQPLVTSARTLKCARKLSRGAIGGGGWRCHRFPKSSSLFLVKIINVGLLSQRFYHECKSAKSWRSSHWTASFRKGVLIYENSLGVTTRKLSHVVDVGRRVNARRSDTVVIGYHPFPNWT